MILTEQQKQVLEKVDAFLSSDCPVFILKGYAGTGKTTIIKNICSLIASKREFWLAAPTGRAARVLQNKVGFPASTIHKLIYSDCHTVLKEKKENNIGAVVKNSYFEYYFSVNQCFSRGVVIVDEASMVTSHFIDHEILHFGTDNLMNDLITFARLSFGGKIIFVGDPAQLPPFGEEKSQALNADFFRTRGLDVCEAELTEVLRQVGISAILQNAMSVRNLLGNEQRNRFSMTLKHGEVEKLSNGSLVNRYVAERQASGRNNCVLIAYSNEMVRGYNADVRQRLLGDASCPLRAGEVLIVVQNNYKLGKMNGDFVEVAEVGNIVSRNVPIYVDSGGVPMKKYVPLNFIHVKIANQNEWCWLYSDLLFNSNPSLTIEESKAFFIDFKIRHHGLKPETQEFANKLRDDEFYNCLRAKFGYAVTGHKCQGGEWGNVFVDFSSRTGLSDDCLRWAYTAITRATKHLYFVNMDNITPFTRFRIDSIDSCSKISEECMVTKTGCKSPFHGDIHSDFLHSKCCCVIDNMKGTPYSVVRVSSNQYMESYLVKTPDGMERYDVRYKKGGLFSKAVAFNKSKHNEAVCNLIDDESGLLSDFDYRPSNDVYREIYDLVSSACISTSVRLTNVVEHPEDYSCMYYFATSNTKSYLKVYIDKSGFVTYAKPMSLIGANDHELSLLIEEIERRFE